MKSIFSISLVLIFLFVGLSDISAQKKRRKSRETTETRSSRNVEDDSDSFGKRLYYEIKLGDLGFGSQFQISGRFTTGFHINNFLSVNASASARYIFVNSVGGQDFSLFDYSIGPGIRGKITDEIYLQGEYRLYSVDNISFRSTQYAPLLGGGYMSGFGNWRFGLEILFILNDQTRDALGGNILEYWFGGSYNF
jgi:hypothetical protein